MGPFLLQFRQLRVLGGVPAVVSTCMGSLTLFIPLELCTKECTEPLHAIEFRWNPALPTDGESWRQDAAAVRQPETVDERESL